MVLHDLHSRALLNANRRYVIRSQYLFLKLGPYYAGTHLLESVLDRLGLSGSADAPNVPARESYAIGGVRGMIWTLRRFLPARDWSRFVETLAPDPEATLDVAPTLLDFLGVPIIVHSVGKSFQSSSDTMPR